MKKLTTQSAQKKAIGYTILIVLLFIVFGVLLKYYTDIILFGLIIGLIGICACGLIAVIYYLVLERVKKNQKDQKE